MSEIKVSKLTNRAGTGAPDFSQGVKIEGTASTLLAPTRTEGATEPTSPANGDTWYDTANDTYDVYINDEWKRFIGASASSAVWYGDRGIIYGGSSNATIDYFDIASTLSLSDFGSVLNGNLDVTGCSDGSRGVITGNSNGNLVYITISTTGDAQSFGSLPNSTTQRRSGSCSDGIYGIWAGGLGPLNNISRITIQTTGDGEDFGDLTEARQWCSACSDATYGVVGGGQTSVVVNTLDYITISTTGNASDYGDLSTGRRGVASLSDDTRGVFSGGYPTHTTVTTRSNVMDYVTIATSSNATDFGDLVVAGGEMGACANGTRGVFTGSRYDKTNAEYITIQTTGNATTFGDLPDNRYGHASFSGAAS